MKLNALGTDGPESPGNMPRHLPSGRPLPHGSLPKAGGVVRLCNSPAMTPPRVLPCGKIDPVCLAALFRKRSARAGLCAHAQEIAVKGQEVTAGVEERPDSCDHNKIIMFRLT